jgi:murein DD-endopeptidase MepM/ murein hydrolase activator NlpD
MLNKLKYYYCHNYLYATVFVLLGYMAFQYHCQHQILTNSIKTYDESLKLYQNKLDEVIEHHNEIFNVCDSLIHIMDSLPLGSPLDTLVISSNFGSRKNKLTQKWEYHPGTDFIADWRDTVYATGHGIIEVSHYNSGYGRTIVIGHGSGYKSRYAHLTRYFVKKGDAVKRGDPIGIAGNTGNSRGYHLHYEVMRTNQGFNRITDPKNYIIL